MDDQSSPGTVLIEDQHGTQVVLRPSPSADPNQPLNWSTRRKTIHMALLSLYAIMVFAILCVNVPLYQDFNEELGISYDQLNNGYATNMATLSIGCIVFIPLALRFGRRPIYLVTALVMLICAIWQAEMQTTGEFISTNAISGLAGAVNEALFQVTVADLFFVHQRETKYNLPPLNGSEVPQDTYSHEKKDAKTGTRTSRDLDLAKSRKSIPSQPLRRIEIDSTIPTKPYRQRLALFTPSINTDNISFWRQIYQPFQLLIQFPAVMFAALQYGFAVAMLAVLAVTQSQLYVLPPYNFTTAGIGNMNLPPAIGALLGTLFGGPLVDYFILRVAKRRGGIYEPETRLWLFPIAGFSMTIGCLMYGLTISKGMPWIINAVGAGFIGFAIGGTGDMALTYVQDSYELILGNAMTGIVFVRNIIGTTLVFAISPWAENMGVYY
ncbi:hypothetical protein AK830_g4349 [Neonectria ditissima]|uniref:Major facilitator superfamily (MFS) profile domain-containing protein n=1 Tax=Neonectria ditissima TaxID=78410 RepID=A0A0P7BLI1_9HYPO|nr:hypothetical protein AK830_g4349 [Neonectria ditissima]